MNDFETLLVAIINRVYVRLRLVSPAMESPNAVSYLVRVMIYGSYLLQDQGSVKSCLVHADEIREFCLISYKKLRN